MSVWPQDHPQAPTVTSGDTILDHLAVVHHSVAPGGGWVAVWYWAHPAWKGPSDSCRMFPLLPSPTKGGSQ